MTDLATRARTLLDLHTAPEILTLVNVWDVVSARVVAGVDGVRALATASHSIAATFGYEDGENIPLELHLDMVGRIAATVDLPVSMDFEGGYGDAGETARRAIAAGAVGGNLEDAMRPLDDAVAAVEAVLRALSTKSIPASRPARSTASTAATASSSGRMASSRLPPTAPAAMARRAVSPASPYPPSKSIDTGRSTAAAIRPTMSRCRSSGMVSPSS